MLQIFKVLAGDWIERQPAKYLVLRLSLTNAGYDAFEFKSQPCMMRLGAFTRFLELPTLCCDPASGTKRRKKTH